MKCPNRNCIEGDVPEMTSETEHLPLICPECQKRFCPSPLCRHRELDADNHCRECDKHFPEHADEEPGEDSSWKDQTTAVSGMEELEDFMKALRRSR
jgi:hypothetical protein